MNLNTWMTSNYYSLSDAAIKISNNNELANELLHYSLEELTRKQNLQEILDSGGANFYVIRIMMNSWKSTTSPFYRIYRKNLYDFSSISYLEEDIADNMDEFEIEEVSIKIKKELSQLHWYEQQLFKIFVDEQHTMSSLSRATQIPRTSISLTINRIRDHIKTKITK